MINHDMIAKILIYLMERKFFFFISFGIKDLY